MGLDEICGISTRSPHFERTLEFIGLLPAFDPDGERELSFFEPMMERVLKGPSDRFISAILDPSTVGSRGGST